MQHNHSHDIFATVPKHDYIGMNDPKHSVDFLDFQKSDVSKATGQPQSSIRYDDRMPKEVKQRILEISTIINIVAEFFEGDLAKTKLWFDTDNPLLGNMSPRDMIRYGRYKKLRKFIYNAIYGNLP